MDFKEQCEEVDKYQTEEMEKTEVPNRLEDLGPQGTSKPQSSEAIKLEWVNDPEAKQHGEDEFYSNWIAFYKDFKCSITAAGDWYYYMVNYIDAQEPLDTGTNIGQCITRECAKRCCELELRSVIKSLTQPSYLDVQREIDLLEGDLEEQGIDVVHMYPYGDDSSIYPDGWTEMPEELQKLYNKRDARVEC
jgi:hypothetical protein